MSEIKKLGPITAYAIACEHGFTGTEAEWLESLRPNDLELYNKIQKYFADNPYLPIENGTVTVQKLGNDVKDVLARKVDRSEIDTAYADDELKLTSTRPVQNRVIKTAINELTTKTNTLTNTVRDVSQRQTSPYNFKGSCAYEDLPGSDEASANDTWYLTDLKYRVTWTGSAWQQSSMDESEYETEIGAIKDATTYEVADLSPLFLPGLIPLYSPAVGDVVDTETRSATSSNKSLVVKCRKGDQFTVTATGGTQGRPWAFLDKDKRLLSKADGNTSVEDLTVTAEEDGYFVSSCTNSAEPPFAVSSKQFFDLDGISGSVENLKGVLHYKDRDLSPLFLPGLIPLYSPAVGDVVDTETRISTNNCRCLVVKCQKGDAFTVIATGGVQARPWAFLDTDKILLSKAAGNTSAEGETFTATQDGYFIASGRNDAAFSVIADQAVSFADIYEKIDSLSNRIGYGEYRLLTDPYLLNFRYGQMSLTGNFTHNVTTLTMRDPIPVKAGDIVSCEEDAQIQLIHSVDGGNSFTDGVRKYTIAHDGEITIGIKYADQRELVNNKVLDLLQIELHTTWDGLRGDNRDRVFFGRVPGAGWYLGKHTDTSGFNQDTNYDTIIAAWDALVNSPYITKEDLGLAEDSQHVYCYHIKPPEFATSLNGKRHPRVVVITGAHGHEKSGSYGLLYLIRDMLDNAMSDPILHYLRDNVEFAIIPVANPWGWNNNSRYNINGVNINRNYGAYNWADMTDETYVTPFAYNYKGTAPFSESETRMIRDVVTRYSDAPIIIDWHTLGGSTGVTTYQQMSWFSHPYYIRNKYDDRLADACMTMLESSKSYFDDVYEVNGGVNQVYGEYANEPNRPTLNTWAFESTNSLSTTLETGNGSKDTFLGSKLRFYSAELIKMSAEMFANYLITILRELAR